MKNLLFLLAMLCLFSTNTFSQSVGLPSGAIFNTDATGGQLGHLQSGTFGDIFGGSRWIAIGQPSGVSPSVYGLRVQEKEYLGIFSVNTRGNTGIQDTEILWGGPKSTLNFKYAPTNNSFTSTRLFTMQPNGRTGIGNFADVGLTDPLAALHVIESEFSGNTTIRMDAIGDREPNLLFSIKGEELGNIKSNGNTASMEFQTRNFFGGLQTAMTITPFSQRVGIGTTNPTERLEVNGNIKVTGTLIFSDKRFKQNIEKLESPMDLLNSINGVSYEYNNSAFPEKSFKEGSTIGFIAQDFRKSLPDLIKEDDKGYLAVNYDGVTPILVEAVKDLDEENQALLEEVNELKALVIELIESQDRLIEEKLNNAPSNTNSLQGTSKLYQNRPNPSNGQTEISYEVGRDVRNVSIAIYDLEGKVIREFNNLPNGQNSVQVNERLATGIYVYTLFADGQKITSKRMVIKN